MASRASGAALPNVPPPRGEPVPRRMVNALGTWLVTGGAGFIGSHLATHLAEAGRPVRVVDNLSTGSLANLAHLDGRVEFIEGDLADERVCAPAVDGVEVV